MTEALWRRGVGLLVLSSLAACTGQGAVRDSERVEPEYLRIETRPLDEELVAFDLTVSGARGAEDIRRFGDCAVAQYAVIRGYEYARHVRTTTMRSGDVWTGDAIYTISAERPPGLEIIVSTETLIACQDDAIPTV